ncbi:unnamed protein product [Paramecium sonneborni]|uniref:Uncharacterized protein n=1 Tax=Paramecium sonneborni TaxID=65129 RepID=A0A8S1RET4_9CILI|nr:unnamed protein product [Paramecium sonneborni]
MRNKLNIRGDSWEDRNKQKEDKKKDEQKISDAIRR